MTRYLPIIILSFVICHLSLVSNVLAQETTTTNTTESQINPQGANPWDSFIDTLIPKTLKNINCSMLPFKACEDISNTNITSDESKSSIKPQENSADNKQNVVEGAYQYNVRSGISLPSKVSNTSTNINDVFGGIINFFQNIAKIFDQGSEAAVKSAQKDLPLDAGDQVITKQSAMNDALAISQCGELPADLCHDNKLNTINSSQL